MSITTYVIHLGTFDLLIYLIAGLVLVAQVTSWTRARGGGLPRSGPEFEKRGREFMLVRRISVLAIDLFPLLGLLGTVLALLGTFAGMGGGMATGEIISSFAPGLTSTVSGLVAAIVNLVFFVLFHSPTVAPYLPSRKGAG